MELSRLMNNKYTKKGFTLLEVIIVGALASIILSFTFLIGSDTFYRVELNNYSKMLATTIHEAQMNSMFKRRDNNVGVRINKDSFTIFEGESYEDRINPLDVTTKFPARLTAEEEKIILFEKGTGDLIVPDSNESVSIFIINEGGNSREITINQEGKIELNL